MDKNTNRANSKEAMYKRLIPNLQAILDEREMSLYQLAHRMKGKPKTNEPRLSRIMRGKTVPQLESVFAIANALEVRVERLLGEGYHKNF